LFVVDDEHQSAVALAIINDPFLILPTVLLELIWVLSSRYEAGADFADMLHIALAKELEATTFATFDNRIKADIVQDLDLALETLT
jgi:predicted nucleic-acid-binding protein